jgi:uncharacterized protein YfcZ (UPF0381/DUF406 family)
MQWFSNGAPQEVAGCAVNSMKVYSKNEKKLICIEIFIHSLKYINTFLILYTKCARKLLYVLQCAANRTSLRTTALHPAKVRRSTTSVVGATLLKASYTFLNIEKCPISSTLIKRCFHSLQMGNSLAIDRNIKQSRQMFLLQVEIIHSCETASLMKCHVIRISQLA